MTSDIVFALLGVALLAAVIWDLFCTTVSPDAGAGRIAFHVGRGIARLGHRGVTAPDAARLALIGPAALIGTLLVWTGLFTAGWWSILSTVDVLAPSGEVVGPADYLAFTLSSVSSLGSSELKPVTEIGRLLESLASFTGLGLLTLAVSYILPVVTAVSERRVQARRISALGSSATELHGLLAASSQRDELLRATADDVRVLTQRHLAYPVLHHFAARGREVALAPNIAALDEAVTALHATRGGVELDPIALRGFRAAVSDLLGVVEHHLPGEHGEAPPWPDDIRPGEEDDLDLDGHRERRRRLEAYVRGTGWSWDDDVHPVPARQDA